MNSSKKILILGSYPIIQPRHGGQKRVQAIVTEYQKRFKYVKYVAIFSRWAHPVHAATDIPVSHQVDATIMENRELEEIITGEAIMTDPVVKRSLSKLLLSYRPDIIQLEQIYPYIGLSVLMKELGLHAQLVYDSHNIEFQMKQDMYQSAGVKTSTGEMLVGRITTLEQDLVSHANLVSAVSEQDASVYHSLGAKHLVVANNGIYPAEPAPAAADNWLRKFEQSRIKHKILYVSSAHLPNWTGFLDVVGEGLGFLMPDTRILIAGGLSDYLTEVLEWPRTPGAAIFWNRVEALGQLSEERLSGLIEASDVIILPINSGGGSNLKTAEALLSGKPIVATSYAFRAYEQFMNYPNIIIANTPKAFQQGILNALHTKPVTLTAEQRSELEAVTWPHCLRNLIKEVASL